jgi:hypothetical protein
MQRSGIRGELVAATQPPDSASLHPGYLVARPLAASSDELAQNSLAFSPARAYSARTLKLRVATFLTFPKLFRIQLPGWQRSGRTQNRDRHDQAPTLPAKF